MTDTTHIIKKDRKPNTVIIESFFHRHRTLIRGTYLDRHGEIIDTTVIRERRNDREAITRLAPNRTIKPVYLGHFEITKDQFLRLLHDAEGVS